MFVSIYSQANKLFWTPAVNVSYTSSNWNSLTLSHNWSPYCPEQLHQQFISFHDCSDVSSCLLYELWLSNKQPFQQKIYVFGLVDHSILLQYPKSQLGLLGPVHGWFKSYLADSHQCVSISVHKPGNHLLGARSGFAVRLTIVIYTLPIGDTVCSHDTWYHPHTDPRCFCHSINLPQGSTETSVKTWSMHR